MAEHRHKRDTNARRTPRAAYVAGPIALVATASAVTLGILAWGASGTAGPGRLAHAGPGPGKRKHHAPFVF